MSLLNLDGNQLGALAAKFVRLAALAVFVPGWSQALEIRSYSASRYDRFTGYPSAPEFNDTAWYGSRNYSGVGWIPGEGNSRQFALVSPQHVVFASHYYPGNGTTIRFLNTDGVTVDRTVVGVQFVLNENSQATDLCLLELSSPITAAEKVPHFPFLNLASESAYTGIMLTIFGWEMKAGRGSIRAIEDSDGTEINTTRLMEFRYRRQTGNQDDAYVVVGDSGSPTFATVGGNPALVGTHTAAGQSTTYYYGYDSFIPHYAGKLDELMADDGYRMTPAYPPSVALAAAVVEDSPLNQAYPGVCYLDLSNEGENDAGNTRLTLHFPEGAVPTSVTAPGWIQESSGPQDWIFRRANLAAESGARVTISWDAVPALDSILVEISRQADGLPLAVQTFDLEPVPTFKAWAAGLEDATETGDSDQDGISNLLEYAFGGNGEVSSLMSEGGVSLVPLVSMGDGAALLRFPVREDASRRGITYVVEYSDSLEADSWQPGTMTLADGVSPYEPEVEGFLMRSVSWNAEQGKLFARVRVTVNE